MTCLPSAIGFLDIVTDKTHCYYCKQMRIYGLNDASRINLEYCESKRDTS